MQIPDHNSKAFTLVELLIVIAIIGILAAIALPVFGKIQTSANITKSLANQRSIATAIFCYTTDKGVLPGPTYTSVSSAEYQNTLPEAEQIKNLRRLLMGYVPEEAKLWVGSNPKTQDFSKDHIVFMLNNRTTTNPRRFFGYPGSYEPLNPMQIIAAGRDGTKSAEVNTPSKIWMMSDADNLNQSQLPANDKRFAPVNGGRVYVFFDGHAAFIKDADRPGNADQRGDL